MNFRSGGGQGKNRQNAGLGAGGDCVCTSCNTVASHQRGIPCYEMSCPNCGAKMTRDGLVENKTQNPTIAEDECIGCGRCINVCPYNAITMVGGKAIINQSLCTGCRKCIASCPVGAIG